MIAKPCGIAALLTLAACIDPSSPAGPPPPPPAPAPAPATEPLPTTVLTFRPTETAAPAIRRADGCAAADRPPCR